MTSAEPFKGRPWHGMAWHEILWVILIQHEREGHATERTYEWLERVNSLLKTLHTKSRQSWLA
jgi:hypothetical protein